MNRSGAWQRLCNQAKSSASNWSAAMPEQQHAGRVQLRMHVCLFCLLQHGVEDTAAECERLGATVQAFVVDCSKREEIYSAAEKVGEQGHVQRLTKRARFSERSGKQEKRYCTQIMPALGISPLLAAFCTESEVALPRSQPVSSSFVRLWRIAPRCQVCSLGFQLLKELLLFSFPNSTQTTLGTFETFYCKGYGPAGSKQSVRP